MTLLYNRTWAIEVQPVGQAGQSFDLDMRFNAKLSGRSKPSTCDVTIYNPAELILGALGKPNTLVRVLAGWESTGATEVARGTVVKHSVEDRSTSYEPEVSFQLTNASNIFANTTLARFWSKTNAEELIRYIANEMGLAIDVFILAKNPTYLRGYALTGSSGRALATLIADCGCQYAIVDGKLRVWPIGEQAKQTADIWDEDSGLLDAMGPGDGSTIRATALLRPGLRPGDVVRINSPAYAGDVITSEANHQGDTQGDLWYTSIIGVPR